MTLVNHSHCVFIYTPVKIQCIRTFCTFIPGLFLFLYFFLSLLPLFCLWLQVWGVEKKGKQCVKKQSWKSTMFSKWISHKTKAIDKGTFSNELRLFDEHTSSPHFWQDSSGKTMATILSLSLFFPLVFVRSHSVLIPFVL